MNEAPVTVSREMSAARAYRAFVTLGMRHLCVVGPQKRIEGIVTRDDFHAAAHGPGSHEGAPSVHAHAPRHAPLAGPPPQVRLRTAVWRGVSAMQFWRSQPQRGQSDEGEQGRDGASEPLIGSNGAHGAGNNQ